MLKKMSLTIFTVSFIMSQACFASSQSADLINQDFDQIGRFQLAYILCSKATTQNRLPIKEFIGKNLLGEQWETALTTYAQTATTNLTWNPQDIASARTKAYCNLHYSARTQERQDVIDFIQHGK